jgi:hypothetical protein
MTDFQHWPRRRSTIAAWLCVERSRTFVITLITFQRLIKKALMNVRTLLLLLAVAVVGVFAAINWSAFTVVTPLWLLFATVQAPLGLIMLSVTALIMLIALAFAAHLKTAMLLESRQHGREMQTQRKLADASEASRLTELQQALESGLRSQSEQLSTARAALVERMVQTELTVQRQVEQSGNTLAAYIGELEDRLERRGDRQG